MFHVHVLRIKCHGLPQGDLLRTTRDPVEVITRSFEYKPTTQVGRGSEWHIGNVTSIKDEAIGFAMGRTQAVTTPQFDATTHDFIEEEAMNAPFTLGVFDKQTQTCGIIRKTGVSQSTSEISRKLAKLLNSVPFALEANVEIVVEPIPNPTTFLEALRRSTAITRFSFTVTWPNPHDVDKLIQGPAKELTREAHGTKTTVEVEGENLNKDLVEDLTKAVAADGQDATANIRASKGAPSTRIYLKGTPLIEKVINQKNTPVTTLILEATRRAYRHIRGTAQQ